MGYFTWFLNNLLKEGSTVDIFDNPDYFNEKRAETEFKAFAKAFAQTASEIEVVVELFVSYPKFNWQSFLKALWRKKLITFVGTEGFREGLALHEEAVDEVVQHARRHAAHGRSPKLLSHDARTLDCFVFLSQLFNSGVIKPGRTEG